MHISGPSWDLSLSPVVVILEIDKAIKKTYNVIFTQ